ncbi:hypothetical protein GE278_20225 [Enterobacteriaceae bacterium Kacie_13]|nr:hypothetical protein GE278_20225 [Enterobacteriaceae bacterium Kacie_13]
MYFIPLKKSVCALSLLIISCYMISAGASESAPAVVHNTHADASVPVSPTAPAATSPAPGDVSVTPVTTPATVTPDAAPVAEHVTASPPGEVQKPAAVVAQEPTKPVLSLNSEEQKRAYASGVALGQYVENQITQQRALHITLDKDLLLAGITDTFNHQEKMSVQDVQETLMAFDEQVKILLLAEVAKKQEADKAFIDQFAKRPGVKKTSKGLYYLIEDKGEGAAINDSNQVEVAYKGERVDGTVVEAPQIENSNPIFRVANMPPVLRDSVKLIRKGGKIKVVVPSGVLESDNAAAKQNNMVMIYTISVVNVNNPQ